MKSYSFALILVCIMCLLFSLPLKSQDISLNTDLQSHEQAIKLSEVSISVHVNGNISNTTVDLLFFNPNDRIMEGAFAFPLKEGQDIVRYALDINGKLREGVVIEKVKARQVFEAVVRKNIDPGIAERTKGNFFKTRIYPIPANGYKRVVIGIDELLNFTKEGLMKYQMPLAINDHLDEFNLKVEVSQRTGLPTISQSYGNIKFDNEKEVYQLNFSRKQYQPNDEISFSVPYLNEKEQIGFVANYEGEKYFYANFLKEIPAGKTKKSPKSIAIYWDNSLSGKERSINKELSFIEEYLESLPGQKKVAVYLFNKQRGKAKRFNIKDDVKSLIEYLKNVSYDGATYLENLQLTDDVEEMLLFSDGIATLGIQNIDLPKKAIVNVVNSSAGSDASFLKYIAEETSGIYINLKLLEISKSISILKRATKPPFTWACTTCEDVYVVSSSNNFHAIMGRYSGDKPALKVKMGKWSQTIDFGDDNLRDLMISRNWAREKIRTLDKRYEYNKDEIQNLGLQYNIVTRNTSFIVLDRVQDYVDYEINPPNELKKTYDSLLVIKKRNEKEFVSTIATENISRADILRTWYQKDFPRESSRRKDEKKGEAERRRNERSVAFDSAVADDEFISSEESELEEIVLEEVDGFADDYEEEVSQAAAPIADKNNATKSPAGKSIKVLPWQIEADYLNELKKANRDQYEEIYFKYRKNNLQRPSFFIQVSHFFHEKGEVILSSRVLSSIIEIDLGNTELLKIVGNIYLQRGEIALAIKVFEEIRELRPDEPQSHRDLALAHESNKAYQKALDLYLFILQNPWSRFNEIKDLALVEMNALIGKYRNQLDVSLVPSELELLIAMDVRVVVSWSSNDNDIDLWVTDPADIKCFYSNKETFSGGKFAHDFTRGYGPESFKQRVGLKGTYQVAVNYFSESRQSVTGPVTVFVTLYTNYGRANEEKQHQVIQLENNKQTLPIGTLDFL